VIKTEIKQWVNDRYYKEITIDNSTFKTMSFKKKENAESYGEYLINKLSERVDKDEEMKEVIKKLNEGLKDPEYRRAWTANIAMAQIDCGRWYREKNNKVGKYLNKKDRYAIANKGAEYFLELLSK